MKTKLTLTMITLAGLIIFAGLHSWRKFVSGRANSTSICFVGGMIQVPQ